MDYLVLMCIFYSALWSGMREGLVLFKSENDEFLV